MSTKPAKRKSILVIDRRDKHGSGSLEKARVFENHQEVFDAITDAFPSHKVVNVRCSDLSVKDQVALFHDADGVVGAEGACLANVLYMRAGATVVNILPAAASYGGIETLCGFSLYWQIANLSGARYWAFLLREYAQETMRVPINRLRAFLAGNGVLGG